MEDDRIQAAAPSANEKAIVDQVDDVLADKDVLHEAYRAETNEHNMGTWEAVKVHPMACVWAFIITFTIVSESLSGQELKAR